MKSAALPACQTLRELHRRHHSDVSGTVADYIPELAKANSEWFGISIVSADGQVIEVGDFSQTFTVQSISKPFVYGLALEEHGRELVLKHVGVEPSGDAFNSIVLDQESNRPFNPMVNAGAIATADLISGKDLTARINRLVDLFQRFTGHDVHVDSAVFMSERHTGHRNRAMAHLMLNFGMVGPRVEETLEIYFQQCSVLVSCHDLAVMGATLANGGINPITGLRAIEEEHVKDILSIMYTCGMYDFSASGLIASGFPPRAV